MVLIHIGKTRGKLQVMSVAMWQTGEDSIQIISGTGSSTRSPLQRKKKNPKNNLNNNLPNLLDKKTPAKNWI